MTPTTLGWIRSEAQRMHASLRHRVLGLYRPPRLLPCWFHGLWYRLVHRFARVAVIAEVEGDCHEVCRHLRSKGIPVSQSLGSVGQVCASVRVRELERLVASAHVRRVWLDREVHTSLDRAITSTGAVRASRVLSGAGVTIAIVDTGIHPHPDLRCRVIGWADMVRRRKDPYDDNGHGTHVAGCAAGDGAASAGRYRGMAPKALLVGVKVMDKLGAGKLSDLLAGIDWVIQMKGRFGIRVLSLSLGTPPAGNAADDPLALAVGRAWQAGLVVVTAAGNEGPESGTISSPGIAPVGITSLRAPRSIIDRQRPESRVGEWYATLSGTSMATPIVAGLVALLLEREPGLTPDGVKERLMTTAEDWGLRPNEQGAGYVDTDGAVYPDE